MPDKSETTKKTVEPQPPAPEITQPQKPKHNLVRNGLIAVAIGLIATSLLMDEPKQAQDTQEIQKIQASFKADGTEARETIAQIRATGEDKNLQAAFDQGETFEKKNEPVNAYLMYFFAAKKGHADSAMKLAKLADPVSGEAQSPEPYQAYKWYKAAADSGVKAAHKHLDKLKEWAQASARNGDQSAQRLLLQWQS